MPALRVINELRHLGRHDEGLTAYLTWYRRAEAECGTEVQRLDAVQKGEAGLLLKKVWMQMQATRVPRPHDPHAVRIPWHSCHTLEKLGPS